MCYHHLDQRERMCLLYLLQSGVSLKEIGRRLNRSHTTLSREVQRNKQIFGCYHDRAAQSFAEKKNNFKA